MKSLQTVLKDGHCIKDKGRREGVSETSQAQGPLRGERSPSAQAGGPTGDRCRVEAPAPVLRTEAGGGAGLVTGSVRDTSAEPWPLGLGIGPTGPLGKGGHWACGASTPAARGVIGRYSYIHPGVQCGAGVSVHEVQ